MFDSAGLALFTVAGTNIALDAGAGTVSAVVIGVISGVGGGIIRDSIADRVPEVLASGHFYASAAVVGSAVDIALLETPMSPRSVHQGRNRGRLGEGTCGTRRYRHAW